MHGNTTNTPMPLPHDPAGAVLTSLTDKFPVSKMGSPGHDIWQKHPAGDAWIANSPTTRHSQDAAESFGISGGKEKSAPPRVRQVGVHEN